MLISVFTPSHITDRLEDAYESLQNQTYQNWERIVLLNNGAKREGPNDPRVKIYYDNFEGPNKGFVGRLKYEACMLCEGERLVELDHDDILTDDCLEMISKVPEEYGFCYGNTVNIHRPKISSIYWPDKYGWGNRPYLFRGKQVVESVSAKPFPQSISRIRFAPNHPRNRRRELYLEMGGHNRDMKISDDHELIQRTYLVTEMYHIDKPLYIYRVRGDNTWQQNAEEIQTTMWQVHDKYFFEMMKKWSAENKLSVLDLGGALGCPEGYHSVDRHNADIEMDLNDYWKLQDDSVGLMRAHHIFEHLKNPIHTMNEAYRCLAHGGILDIEVPSACGIMIDGKYYPPLGAHCDPTHVSFWNERSFRYFTEPNMRKYIEPECECKFTIIKPVHTVLRFDNIPCVKVTLMAEKGGHRFYGENHRRKGKN